jgi:hypothetical protein
VAPLLVYALGNGWHQSSEWLSARKPTQIHDLDKPDENWSVIARRRKLVPKTGYRINADADYDTANRCFHVFMTTFFGNGNYESLRATIRIMENPKDDVAKVSSQRLVRLFHLWMTEYKSSALPLVNAHFYDWLMMGANETLDVYCTTLSEQLNYAAYDDLTFFALESVERLKQKRDKWTRHSLLEEFW